MKVFDSNHPRLVAATPALSPAVRRAAYPGGVTEARLLEFERDAGIGSAKSTPAAAVVKPAVEAKPAPTAPAPISTSMASTSRRAAPVAAPPNPSVNPFLAAVSRVTNDFNLAHSKEDPNA